jgi:hypothetical protein
MSALLFGALAQGAAGCIFVSDDDGTSGTAEVAASWSIFNGDAAADCPPGATTAAINAQLEGDSTPFVDLYNCSDGAGLADTLPAGNYTVWVDLTDDSGATLFAQSEAANITLSDGEHASADFQIDGFNGFWDVSWRVMDSTGTTEVGCAGATGQSGASVLSTNTDTTTGYDSVWDCTAGEGAVVTTDPVPVGGYVIVLSVLTPDPNDPNNPEADLSMGDSAEIQESILHGNEFVNLGEVDILLF